MAEEEKGPEAPYETVSEQEMQIAYSGPALATNKFYVSFTPGGVRIAFTEINPQVPLPSFRTAVMLPLEDAMSLASVLKQMMDQYVVITPMPEEVKKSMESDGAENG